MRGLLVCALVLALGLVVNAGSSCVCHHGNYHQRSSRGCSSLQGRVDLQTARISRMSARIQELQSKLDSGKDKRAELVNQQGDIAYRLNAMEARVCDKKEFHCGKSDGNCVSDLLVCDGSNDCSSHGDEDEKLCKNPCTAGSEFYAEIHEDPHLCTRRRLKSAKIVITSERRLNWFKSRVLIEANVELDHSTDDEERHDTLHAHGYYHFAKRRLVLHPPEDDRLGLTCDFDGVDSNSCHAAVVREASLDRCLEFHAHRNKH